MNLPGMGSTGKVSSINGVINCTGYVCAAIANAAFGKLLGLSWNGVIFVWCGIAAIGLIASLVVRQEKSKRINYENRHRHRRNEVCGSYR